MSGGILSWRTVMGESSIEDGFADSIAAERAITPPDTRLLELETTYILRRPDVVRSLVKYGVDFIEAEDITQEVFLRTLDRPQQQNPPDNLFSWLLTCARNLAVDRYRHRRKEIAVPAAVWKQWEKEMADPKVDTEASVLEEDRYNRMTDAISRLTEQEQQCLALRSQGVSFREIATILNVSLRQAAYITDVAVDKLRRRLHSTSR